MKRDLPRPAAGDLRPAPEGLTRCVQCGELYGWALFPEPPDHTKLSPGLASCLCEGIVCSYCKKNAIHRPISDYYEEETGILWHVPYFAHRARCAECRRRGVKATAGSGV